MHDILDILGRWRPFTAVVVGDYMLDELVYGDAERLSADAPVPVLLVRRREHRAGGSANVCLALAALGGKVKALGVTGADAAGGTLRATLASDGVDCAGLVEDPARPTTLKQNLIGLAQARHPQKMFRLDEESRSPLSPDVVRRLCAAFDTALAGADVICIEDYNKGVCTPELCRHVITAARRAGKPVFVDPARGVDYAKYAGATVITPNRTEAEEAAGMKTGVSGDALSNEPVARLLLEKLDLAAVVLTLDRQGALLLEAGRKAVAAPTVAREVYDVTGAGDEFLAALAAARANGADWPQSVRFANAAAGLEVEVFGVQPIPLEAVHASLLRLSRDGESSRPGKLRTTQEIAVEAAAVRKRGGKVVFTNGCFDILHSGHVHLLDRAKAEGDYLIVATNTDEKVREYKGPNRPVNRLEDRVRVLSGLAAVDAVCVFAEDTPAQLIEQVQPDVLVKGDEYTDDRIPGAAFVKANGGRVVRIPMVQGQSTTTVLRRSGDSRAETVQSASTAERFIQDRSKGA